MRKKLNIFSAGIINIGKPRIEVCGTCESQFVALMNARIQHDEEKSISQKEYLLKTYPNMSETVREYLMEEPSVEQENQSEKVPEANGGPFEERAQDPPVPKKESVGYAIQIVCIILAVVIALALLFIPVLSDMFSSSSTVFLGLGILLGGFFIAAIVGLFFYGFGELLINVNALNRKIK